MKTGEVEGMLKKNKRIKKLIKCLGKYASRVKNIIVI